LCFDGPLTFGERVRRDKGRTLALTLAVGCGIDEDSFTHDFFLARLSRLETKVMSGRGVTLALTPALSSRERGNRYEHFR
jgi:hypothetical protein